MKLPHQTTEGDLYELPVIFIQLVRPAAFIFSTASASAFAEQNEKREYGNEPLISADIQRSFGISGLCGNPSSGT